MSEITTLILCAISGLAIGIPAGIILERIKNIDEIRVYLGDDSSPAEKDTWLQGEPSAEDMARLEKAIKGQAQVNRLEICNCPTCKRIKASWHGDKFAGDKVKLERKS